MTATDAGDRIDALEIRIAHQERTIEELNEALTAQWREVDLVTRRLARLEAELAEALAARASPGLPEPPPPHY
jgi:SlyX protein